MSRSNIFTVYRKELTDSLRDRRTLISMVVVPIVIFPLISIGMFTFIAKVVGKALEEVPKVMILSAGDSPHAVEDLKAIKGIDFIPGTPDYALQISDKKIRAAVDVPAGFDAAVDHDTKMTLKIYNYEGDLKSGIASDKIEKYLKHLQTQTR